MIPIPASPIPDIRNKSVSKGIIPTFYLSVYPNQIPFLAIPRSPSKGSDASVPVRKKVIMNVAIFRSEYKKPPTIGS